MRKLAKLVQWALVAGCFVAALGALTMLLWNALVPKLFQGPSVDFLQATGLVVLSHILFRGGGFRHGGWHHRRWKHNMQERLAAMTPGEREQFLQRWDQWACCPWSGDKGETRAK